MAIRFMDEVAKDIENRGEISLPDNYITGEAFEKWLYEPDDIVLSKEATEKLRYNLLHPDKEAFEKRDRNLAGIKQTVTKNKDGSFVVDCPDLDLNNIDELSQQS